KIGRERYDAQGRLVEAAALYANRGVSTIDAGGEFIARGRSKINSCCFEGFLLWGEGRGGVLCHCIPSRSLPCRKKLPVSHAPPFRRVTSIYGCGTRLG